MLRGLGFNRLSMGVQDFEPAVQKAANRIQSEAETFAVLQLTIERLTQAGYVYIGMDHFARPDDELTAAQRNGTLYRNFQGYSTHAECDMIGMGITAIGMVGDC